MGIDPLNNGGMNRDRVSERDRLELDENGQTRGEKAKKEAGKPIAGGSAKGKFKETISKPKVIVGLVAAGALIYFASLGNGGFVNMLRTFNSTPSENIGSMVTAIQKVDRDNKTVGQEQDPLYDVNNLFTDIYIQQQVDKEYAVFVYTGDEALDQPFREWVLSNEKDIPIYRVNVSEVKNNYEAMDYIEADTPMVFLYNEVERDKKELDAVIKDKDLLKNIVPHILEIQEKKKQKAIESRGTSGNN